MKRYSQAFIIFLVFILDLCITADAGASERQFTLKVGVARKATFVSISGVDYSASKQYARIFEKCRLAKNFTSTLSASSDGSIIINNKNTGVDKLYVYPKKNSYLKINDRTYRGYFEIRASEKSISVINQVGIEDYLKSVVPSEMEPESCIEALKAQAVVARTYALSIMGKHKSAGFDLCNSTCCQVYKGVSQETAKTSQAVAQTAGKIIIHGGKAINAYYSASCGGYTESIEEAWPGAPSKKYSRVVECPYCEKDKKVSWKYKVSKKEFISKMRKAGFNISNVLSAKVSNPTRSGRIDTVEMKVASGTLYYASDLFRKIFGNTNIKSSNFNVYVDRTKTKNEPFKFNRIDDIISARNDYNKKNLDNSFITFSGSGYGHGVGMCQHGAKKMADAGRNYTQIIKYYFTKDVSFKKIY